MKIGVAIPSSKTDLAYIRRCLDSIERQSYKPICVAILISNCRVEDVPDYKYSFPIKIGVTTLTQNVGMNCNRAAELLLENLEIDVISFFGSGDEMVPERLNYISKAFVETKCDFVLHNVKGIRGMTRKK